MKIMDEKGRLFGKLNIIDLLVILLVIAAVVLFFVRRDPAEEEKEVKYEVTYQVKVQRLTPEFYETVQKYVDPKQGLKDQMFSSDSNNKFLDAYVEDFALSPHVEYLATSDGEIKVVESSGDDKRMDAIFTIHAWVTDPVTLAVGLQQLRVGVGHYVKTTHFECSGTIVGVERADQ